MISFNRDSHGQQENFQKPPRRNDATTNISPPGFPKKPGDTDAVASKIVEAAFKIHRTFGPGLLESIYEKSLFIELRKSGCMVECQVPLPIVYRGESLDSGYRIDMQVDRRVIVENKTVDRLEQVHVAQVLTYLKLTGFTLGLIINWSMALLKDGLKRVVLRHPESRPKVFPRR